MSDNRDEGLESYWESQWNKCPKCGNDNRRMFIAYEDGAIGQTCVICYRANTLPEYNDALIERAYQETLYMQRLDDENQRIVDARGM